MVRYLARYTSRIAMSNQRIKGIDEEERTVTFEYKDYADGAATKEMTMSGAVFVRSFARHLVPKGFRRVRYFGLLAGTKGRHRELPGAPQSAIGEKAARRPRPACRKCGGCNWRYLKFFHVFSGLSQAVAPSAPGELKRFSLGPPDTG
ncbi:MAG: transposase [Akkermansiaceae bacterium]|nr:transposase [Akkermansiaceae bacterium]